MGEPAKKWEGHRRVNPVDAVRAAWALLMKRDSCGSDAGG